MQIMLPRVGLLELLQKPEQEKNETTGKYVDTGNMKDVLVVYPYGQDIKFKNAGCLNIAIDPLRIKDIRPFLGKMAMLELDQEQTKSGATFYRFINVYAIPSEMKAPA